jgi:hypothetical protein
MTQTKTVRVRPVFELNIVGLQGDDEQVVAAAEHAVGSALDASHVDIPYIPVTGQSGSRRKASFSQL